MEKTIAEMVINRFENGLVYKNNSMIGNMSFGLRGYKPYHDEGNCEYRLSFNEAAKRLEEQDLIKIAWLERDKIIDRIQFRMKDVAKIYDQFKIIPKGNVVIKLAEEIEVLADRIKTPWIKKYLDDLRNEIIIKRAVPKTLSNGIQRDSLFKALAGLDKNQGAEILERVFSKKYLGSSKAFEKDVRSRLVSIAKRYAGLDENLGSAEVLSEFGIEKTIEELFLKGSLTLRLEGKIIDLTGFKYGVGLNTKTLVNSEIAGADFGNVLSIENKANFMAECESREGWLLVFSSGYYSPWKRAFLKKISDYLAGSRREVRCFHWGDMDFKGFNMYRQIKEQVFPNLEPYKMDMETYIDNLKHGETMGWNQRHNLIKLAESGQLQEFEDLIAEIIKRGKTLKQEVKLFEKDKK